MRAIFSLLQDSGCGGSYSGGCGAVTLPEPVYSYGQGYNPGMTQVYSAPLTQSYANSLPQGLNPGVTCLGNGCPGAQTTSGEILPARFRTVQYIVKHGVGPRRQVGIPISARGVKVYLNSAELF